MKLSDLENEKALDALADILEPASEIFTDEKVKQFSESGKPKILLIKYILKEHKRAVVEILSALHGETPKTYKFNILSVIGDLKDMIESMDKAGLSDFFCSWGQKEGKPPSGAAMGITKDERRQSPS